MVSDHGANVAPRKRLPGSSPGSSAKDLRSRCTKQRGAHAPVPPRTVKSGLLEVSHNWWWSGLENRRSSDLGVRVPPLPLAEERFATEASAT